MTLARTALRLATIAALQGTNTTTGPTIACNRVYDSRIDDFSPETYPSDALPTVIVYTDEDEGEGLSHQNGGPPFKRLLNLVMEFAMVQGFDVPVANGGTTFVPGYPATDAEHEASLDFLEFQIGRQLAECLDPLPILWRSFTRVWKHDCHRNVLDDSGVKIAARILTWQVEVPDDQIIIYNTADDDIPTGLDVLPEPLKRVAKALAAGPGLTICTAIANALNPLTAGPLNGVDFTYDKGGSEDPNDMFGVTMEIRTALDVPQIVGSGAVTIDYSKGTFQNLIVSGDITAMAIVNWPTTGKTGRLILQTTNTGNFAIAWPTGTEWSQGAVGVLTQGAGKKDVFVLTTASAGTEIFGNTVGQDYQ